MGFLDWLLGSTEEGNVTVRGEPEREEVEDEVVFQLMGEEEWRDEVHRGLR